MSEALAFSSRDGRPCRGELVLPAGTARVGAVIVVHEWWGVNDDIRAVTERFAAAAYLALAVDLYGGRVTTDPNEAMKLSNEMKTLEAMEIVAGALAALAVHPRCNGKVAIAGFCLGGAVSLAAACLVPGLAAAVPFYGTPKDEYVDWTKLAIPVLAHFGEKDPIIPAARPRAIAERVHAAGGAMELHLYDAGHAFMRASDPLAFHAPSAALAWERTLAFLGRSLA
jgi:carboxymethylenebutenolidase